MDLQKFDERMVHMYLKALHTAISTKKTRVFIMFIDEFDKKIQKTSNVLEYMNCHDNEVDDEYLSIVSDIGDILPVCAGNKRPAKIHKCHVPLDDRFVKIYFSSMTQEIKKSIIYDVMNIPKSIAIDLIIGADKFHGLRQLLMKINLYRSAILGQEFFKGTSWEKIITEQLRKDVGEDDADSDLDNLEPPKELKTDLKITRLPKKRVRSKSPAKRR